MSPPLNQLPSLPHLEPGDLDLATHFVRVCHRVEPADQPSPFRGRIWVLVDESVYSASESFALFCQQTGFATLVGSATSGDGIGTDPVFLQLPNSGILVQYPPVFFGLNPDGSSNEELGTLPDLLSPQASLLLSPLSGPSLRPKPSVPVCLPGGGHDCPGLSAIFIQNTSFLQSLSTLHRYPDMESKTKGC